jgi:putative hydrolase of the HAD superfamily
MQVSTLLFDLDDTLYPSTTGLWELIRRRIDLYMHERLNLDWSVIPQLRHDLFTRYGTTMRGLQTIYQISVQDYLDFVHDVPVQQYLTADPAVREVIARYPQRKVIFTNSDSNHAMRVLTTLKLDDLFERIVDIRDISPYCKPMPDAFCRALEILGEPDPSKCVMIDDNPPNLDGASQIGMHTIYVGEKTLPHVDACIPCLQYLPQVLTLSDSEENSS